MRKVLLSLLASLLVFCLKAQVPGIQWQVRYGPIYNSMMGGSYEFPPLALPDGGFLIPGFGRPPGAIGTDVEIRRVNADGMLVWKKYYGDNGPGQDAGGGVYLQRSNDGNYLLISATFSTTGMAAGNADPSNGNLWIVKFDGNGNVLGKRIFHSMQLTDWIHSFTPTSDGSGYLLTYAVYSNSGGFSLPSEITRCASSNTYYSYKFLKLDNNFNILKQKCLTDEGQYKQNFYLLPAASGKYFLFEDPAVYNCVMYRPGRVSLVNDTLGTIWTKPLSSFNLPHNSYALGQPFALKQNSNAFIFPLHNLSNCIEYGLGTNPPPNPSVLLKLDTLGNLVWKKELPVGGGQSQSAADAGDGNSFLLFHGRHEEITVQRDSFQLLRIAYSDGAVLGQRSLGYFSTLAGAGYVNKEIRPITNGMGQLYFWGVEAGSYSLGRLGPVNEIAGRAFVDGNNNGVFDTGDTVLVAKKILAQKDNGHIAYAFTDLQGRYSMNTDTGTYRISVEGAPTFAYFTLQPATPSVSRGSYGFSDTLHLRLVPIPNTYDVSPNLVGTTATRPGFTSDYLLTYTKNSWYGPAGGVVGFVKDPRTTVESTTPAGYALRGTDTLEWTYSGLLPLRTDTIRVRLRLAPPLLLNSNDTLRFEGYVGPQGQQTDLLNDRIQLRQRVTNALDPNDKQERNAGRYANGQLLSGEPLQYTIRFQNTGTAAATTVVVRDTLSDLLDWSTVKMTGASHAYSFTVRNDKDLEWTFANINLPDSFSNEPASHGFLTFQVLPRRVLDAGEAILNRAAIYFDYNAPVYTNTQETRMYASVFTTGIRSVEIQALEVTAAPNPAQQRIRLQVRADKAYSSARVRLLGINGAELRSQRTSLRAGINRIELPADQLPGALYIAAVDVNGKTYTTILVKQ